MVNDLRAFIIRWNNSRPLDREFRKKYNIAFNSPQHRAMSQFDIALEWMEEKLFQEAIERATDRIERDKELEKGIWLRENRLDEDVAMDIFDKIDVTTINENSPIQFE